MFIGILAMFWRLSTMMRCFIRIDFDDIDIELFSWFCQNLLSLFFLSSSTIVIEFLWRNRASRTYWKRMPFCAKVARSFTRIVNRIGPNIEPCGTPKDTNCLVDMFSWLDCFFFWITSEPICIDLVYWWYIVASAIDGLR